MPKKFEPTPELRQQILIRYKETSNYSLISRETNLSVAIVKRIIQEGDATSTVAAKPNIPTKKPTTTAQILAYKKEYVYVGLPPFETTCPKKTVYYGLLAQFKQEFLDV